MLTRTLRWLARSRPNPAGGDALGALQRDFKAMASALESTSQELQRQTRQLRMLTEHLPVYMAYVDREQRYQFCNAQYERDVGVPSKSWVGQRLSEVMGEDDYNAIEPYVLSALRGESVHFEVTLETRNGKVDFLIYYVPDVDANGDVPGFFALRLDISERRAMEQQLVEALAWQQAMFDSSNFAVIATDTDGLIQAINPAGLRMLRYEADELVGQHTPTRFHDPVELVRCGIALSEAQGRTVSGFAVLAAQTGEAQEREWTYIRRDGSRLPVSLSVTAIQGVGGAVTGFLTIAADITERKQAEALIRHQAHHDSLTQLPNRTLMDDRLAVAMQRAQRSGQCVAIAMVDLDHFKRINDKLGHPVGDSVLQTVAQRLRLAVRPSDTVARVGGDEFVVVLDGMNKPSDIHRIARSILDQFAEPVLIDAHELQLSASVGVAVFPTDGTETALLLKNADAAMYDAKAAGRNTYRLFDRQMMSQNTDRMEMELALRHAMERSEMRLEYQPQFDLETGEIMGVEALLRWDNPVLGSVPPSVFIGLAEECGLIQPIGHWVLQNACHEAMDMQKRLGRRLGLAVNLSPVQFAQADLPELVAAALRDSGMMPNMLELEITEGIFLLNSERTISMLNTIRAMGVSVSIDDFGTGYSSLSYLTRYTVDWIKIDQSFVHDLPHGKNAAVLTTAIISIAHSLGMMVIAEGIETREQYDYLLARGCDLGQGFWFSEPMSKNKLVDWLENHTTQAATLARPALQGS
jgi:diguanylate cyclase (GGDEF)-like protein/PAS domain S-box-containing protein